MIKINEMTLRELLVFQSIYLSKTNSDIIELIQKQPNPTIFFKSYLEFDCANLISILSFEAEAIGYLLRDANKKYFGEKYPLFYKNKYNRGNSSSNFYRNSIDNALRMN